MSIAASLLQGQSSDGALSRVTGLPSNVLKRRVLQRRQMQAVQAASCSLTTSVLLFYSYIGTVSIGIAATYFLCGIALTGFFVALSETNVNDRFKDHYLTLLQISGHVLLQFGFLLAAPEIGYAFLGVLFLIFAFGALRITSQQVVIAWTFTALGLIPIFLLTSTPIGMPVGTHIERVAAVLCYILIIGQCAFVGLYGSTLRKMLYDRGFELKEANKRIKELAELDELTGSLNRRSIMQMLNDEASRAHYAKSPCSVALIDLDWFKLINDTYGHPTGDEVLRTFAITIFANIRDNDRFGRFGGEEFLLLLPDTPADDAARILDRLREIIADLDWSAFSPGMQVTVSAGIATLKPDETPDSFLARADRALYAAKDRGRNLIVSA
jgi:diguanylate cyclase (GGDEF)-like protein